jgi:hypothetical protein
LPSLVNLKIAWRSLTAFGGDFQAAATAFLVVARSDPPDTDHAADR